jgi:hypothetical protein
MAQWHAPCDPECEEYERFINMLYDDPMTKAMGAPVDEIVEAYEQRHRALCERCSQYGVANIEVK